MEKYREWGKWVEVKERQRQMVFQKKVCGPKDEGREQFKNDFENTMDLKFSNTKEDIKPQN